MSDQYELILFVSGQTTKTKAMLEQIETVCKSELKGNYSLTTIDVLENPDLAEREKIIATPTLIKKLPPPIRQLVGDFMDAEKIIIAMDLRRRP